MAEALSAHHLHLSLGSREVLRGVDAHFQAGQVTGLIGANGAGKTTLLRALAGVQPAAPGQVKLGEKDVVSGAELARRLAYVEQRPTSQWALTVEDIVLLGRQPHIRWPARLRQVDRDAVEAALREADVLHLRGQSIHRLSGGEQARVFLARALAAQTEWLLADEPVAGLDPAQQLRIMALLREKARQGMGVIVSLHDLTLAQRFCDKLLLLHEGKVLAAGAPEAVLADAHLEAAYGLFAHKGQFREQGFLVPWEPLSKD